MVRQRGRDLSYFSLFPMFVLPWNKASMEPVLGGKNGSIFTFECLLLGSNQYLYLKKKHFSTFPAHCFGVIVCNNPTDRVCHSLLKSTTAVSTKKWLPHVHDKALTHISGRSAQHTAAVEMRISLFSWQKSKLADGMTTEGLYVQPVSTKHAVFFPFALPLRNRHNDDNKASVH